LEDKNKKPSLDTFPVVQEKFPWNIESSQQASDFDLSLQQFIEFEPSEQQQQFIPIEPSKQKEEQLIELKPAQLQLIDVGVRRFNDESVNVKNQTLETSGKDKNKDWKDKCVRQDDGMYVCADSTLQALDNE
jgi:hypothetical protein